jgi:hypothetical protein
MEHLNAAMSITGHSREIGRSLNKVGTVEKKTAFGLFSYYWAQFLAILVTETFYIFADHIS